MLKVAGRYLDKNWRRFRPYLLPEFKQAYKALLSHSEQPPTSGKRVLFDFNSNIIDGPQGRRFYGLFTFFTRSGYYPVFVDHYAFLANPRANFKAECFKQPFSVIRHPEALGPDLGQVLVITDQAATSHSLANTEADVFKVSLVVDEYIAANEFPWPFPMFPGVYRLNQDADLPELRRQQRPWLFFFGGQSASHKYDKSWVRTVYGKVTRGRYLQIARQALADLPPRIEEPDSRKALDKVVDAGVDVAVLAYSEQCKIPLEQWLPTMARSRYFLACPGVRYPMSHNAVEALAVGSVPIIEYPEDFYPALEDGVNCLVFSGESGLKAAIARAHSLSEAEWKRLSDNAINYYERHQSPEAVISSLLVAKQSRGVNTIKLVPFLKRGGGHI